MFSNDFKQFNENKQSRKSTKTAATAVLGGTALLLILFIAVVTVFYLGASTVKYVRNVVMPDETPAYFENYLSPVVMLDPQPFKSLSKANPDWILEASIWALIAAQNNNGDYKYTEDNKEILPGKDITAEAEKYFGGSVKLNFHTFSADEAEYVYNGQQKCFYIPVTALSGYYTPRVTKIAKGIDRVVLTVQYISGTGWGQSESGSSMQRVEPAVSKTMQYVLKSSKGNFIISSIESTGGTQTGNPQKTGTNVSGVESETD